MIFIPLNATSIESKSTTASDVGPGMGAKKMVKPRMDLAKALGTMGFGAARKVDAKGERDAQDELNDALTRLMNAHEMKKKKVLETEKVESRVKLAQDKLRNEVRTVHEAYQFLAKKYKYDKQRLKEKQLQQTACEEISNLPLIENNEEQETDAMKFENAINVKTAAIRWRKGKPEDTDAD